MALIKCPECGREVSTEASSCPHCGFPLKKADPLMDNLMSNKARDKSWINDWKRKVVRNKLIWLGIYLLCTGLFVLFLMLLIFDKELIVTKYSSRYETKTIYIILTPVGGALMISSFIIFMVNLFMCKVRTREYDDYTILVYVGFKHYLVIEGVVKDSGVTNRYLYGVLPNKKNVWAEISPIDNSVKIGVGSTGDEKQIL